MRFKILILSCIVSLPLISQVSDIAKLAKGSLKASLVAYTPDHKVFGYLQIYVVNKEKDKNQLEYVFLDKNLNRSINSNYSEPVYKRTNIITSDSSTITYTNCYYSNKTLILERLYKKYKTIYNELTTREIATTYQTISLNSNTASDEIIVENGSVSKFDNSPKHVNELKKTASAALAMLDMNQTQDFLPVFTDNFTGFLINTPTAFKLIDLENKVSLEIEKKESEDKTRQIKYDLKFVTDKTAYIKKEISNVATGTDITNQSIFPQFRQIEGNYILQAYDLKTGKLMWENEQSSPDNNHLYSCEISERNGLCYLSGYYINKADKSMKSSMKWTNATDFSISDGIKNSYAGKSEGLYLKAIDANGTTTLEKELAWAQIADSLHADKSGLIEKKYKLIPFAAFIFKSGKISLLTQRLNIMNIAETNGAVLLNLDNTCKLQSTNLLNSTNLKHTKTKLLFTQNMIDENTGAFFNLIIKESEAELNLDIHTLTDGQLHTDTMSVYKKNKPEIYIFPAKEGYVLINEITKKPFSNEFRLEKIIF